MIITTEQKYELVTRKVTLNGQPAKISGALQPFAIVATLAPNGPAIEFSWQAVARIVAAGGKFKA